MNRNDITELHYITPLVNVPSIMAQGILSHNAAAGLPHASVAMQTAQERRKDKQIPGARRLHDYANLYFDAHNPMLSARRAQNNELCVLRIDARVIDLPDVIIADINAASDMVRFFTVPMGLAAIDRDRLFDRFWIHRDDPLDERLHKWQKCAEVLVPDRVVPGSITGAYVAHAVAQTALQALNTGLPVSINPAMFF